MRSMKFLLYGTILMLALMPADCFSAQDSISNNKKVLAIIPVVSGSIDQSVYRRLDRLVPELKKISKDKIVKLECSFAGQAEREKDVIHAYQTVSRIEKYLRVQHKLELDFWITIGLTSKKTKLSPVITIAVFTDEIKNIDSAPVVTEKNYDSDLSGKTL